MTAQLQMTRQTVSELHRAGVAVGTPLPLEFFFYTDSAGKAAAVSDALRALGYQASQGDAGDDSGEKCVSGWSAPVPVQVDSVSDWVSRMCALGCSHDCEFDGWGTKVP